MNFILSQSLTNSLCSSYSLLFSPQHFVLFRFPHRYLLQSRDMMPGWRSLWTIKKTIERTPLQKLTFRGLLSLFLVTHWMCLVDWKIPSVMAVLVEASSWNWMTCEWLSSVSCCHSHWHSSLDTACTSTIQLLLSNTHYPPECFLEEKNEAEKLVEERIHPE